MAFTQFEIAGGIKNMKSGPLDGWRGPYATVEAACAAIPNISIDGINFREGKIVDIGSTGNYRPYWWQGGYADGNLVEQLLRGFSAYEIAVQEGFVGTEEEWIQSIKQPSEDAAELAIAAADNANTATDDANTATENANTATTNANDATEAANTATENANSATTAAQEAALAANNAAETANNAKGWTPDFVTESDGAEREVLKLVGYYGGTGSAPTTNVGKYLGPSGYVTLKADATNFKGSQGIPGISTTNMAAMSVLGNDTASTGTPKSLTPKGLMLFSNSIFSGEGDPVRTGNDVGRIVVLSNPKGGYYKSIVSSPTGAIKIKLPTNTAVMVALNGTINDHSPTGAISFTICCYCVSMNSGSSAVINGRNVNLPVRWFTDGTSPYVAIGELTQVWSTYLGVTIDSVQLSMSGASASYVNSFALEISVISAFTGTQANIRVNSRPDSNPNQIMDEFVVGANTSLANTDTLNQMLGKTQAQINNRVPYTGANSPLNLNTQSLILNGLFDKYENTFNRNILGDEASSTLNFKKIENVASLSRGNDSSTIGDIVLTLPIASTTKWVAEIFISNGTTTSDYCKLLLSAYNTTNLNPVAYLISGKKGLITQVKFGRDNLNNTIIIIKRSAGTSIFHYGKVNIESFYHFIVNNAALAVKSNFKAEFIDESTLSNFTLSSSIPVTETIHNNGSSANLLLGDGTYQALSSLPAFTATKLLTARNINGVAFDGTGNITVVDSTKIPTSEKGAVNGVATLGADQKLTASQVPAIAITDTFVVNSQAAMLALTAQVGDVCVRTDLSNTFILKTEPATTLANWEVLLHPASPVSSVAGRTGAVTLAVADVSGAEATANKAINLTSPDNTKYPTTKAVSDALSALPAPIANLKGSSSVSGGEWNSGSKDVTVTGAATTDIVTVNNNIRKDASYIYLISATVISTNTVRLYFTTVGVDPGSSDASTYIQGGIAVGAFPINVNFAVIK